MTWSERSLLAVIQVPILANNKSGWSLLTYGMRLHSMVMLVDLAFIH